MRTISNRLGRYETLLRAIVTLLLMSVPIFFFARVYPDSVQRIVKCEVLETHISRYGEGNSVKAIEMRLLLFSVFTVIGATSLLWGARFIGDSRLAHAILVIGTATISIYLFTSFLNPGALLVLYVQRYGLSVPRLLGITYVLMCLLISALLLHFALTARSHHGRNYIRSLLRIHH